MSAPVAESPFGLAVPVVMGHRGAPRVAPENTPAAFAAAAAAGATWVELDVRRAVDGLVVCHDPCTPEGVPLIGLRAAELHAQGIWPLAEVLDGLPPGLGVDVEVKNLPGEPDYDETAAVADLVAPLLAAAARRRLLVVTSFNPATLAAIGETAPAVPRGLLHTPALRARAALELVAELEARVLCTHVDTPDLGAAVVAEAHERGVAVLVWTVDDAARAVVLASEGVDALCTNEPAALVAAVGSAPMPPR